MVGQNGSAYYLFYSSYAPSSDGSSSFSSRSTGSDDIGLRSKSWTTSNSRKSASGNPSSLPHVRWRCSRFRLPSICYDLARVNGISGLCGRASVGVSTSLFHDFLNPTGVKTIRRGSHVLTIISLRFSIQLHGNDDLFPPLPTHGRSLGHSH